MEPFEAFNEIQGYHGFIPGFRGKAVHGEEVQDDIGVFFTNILEILLQLFHIQVLTD